MHKFSVVTGVLLLSTGLCFADTTQPADPGLTFTVTPYSNYAAQADFGHGSGTLSVFRAGTTLEMATPVSQSTEIKVALQGEYSHYAFKNLSAVPDGGSDSFDGEMIELRPSFVTKINDDWSVFGGVIVDASADWGARWGQAFTYGAYAGVSYKISDNLYVGGGFGFSTQLEDDALVLPIGSLTWNFADNWTLTSDGLGARVTYKFNDNLDAYVDGRYTFRQYRLAANDVIANGAIFDQSVPITVGATYHASDALSVSAEVGAVVYRRVEFWSSGGNEAGADEANPALFAGVELEYDF